MAAASWPIKIEQGSQFDLYVTLYDSQCVAKDVTGYGAQFEVRLARGSTGTPLYLATVGGSPGVITLQPDFGDGNGSVIGMFHVMLPITTVDSPPVSWAKAEWDLVVWPPDGSIIDRAKRIVGGEARWSPTTVFP